MADRFLEAKCPLWSGRSLREGLRTGILSAVRVAIMTAGSGGDVAPFTGLGHALVRAGHEVTLFTHARFAPLVTGSGVGFHALPLDPRAELESERGRGQRDRPIAWSRSAWRRPHCPCAG